MKRLLKLVLSLAALFVLGLLVLNILVVSPETVRDQLVQKVKAETGRELSIYGSASLAFWPNAHLLLTDAILSAPGGAGGGTLLRIPELKLELALLPLLRREVAVNRFVLERPVMTIRIDANGHHNWQFGHARGGARSRARPQLFHAGFLGAPSLQQLSLDDVEIKDGTVHIIDESRGVEHNFEQVRLALTMPRSGPLDAKGSFVWRAERVTLAANLADPRALLAEAPSQVRIDLASGPVTGKFTGTLSLRPAFAADGDLAAEIPSIKALLGWIESALAPIDGIDSIGFDGNIAAKQDEITIRQARFAIDNAEGQGQAVLTLGEKPHLRAALAIERLNLNPFLARLKAQAAFAPGAQPPLDVAQAQNAAQDPLSDAAGPFDVTEAPQPEVAAPNFEADVNVNFGSLRVQRLNIGKSEGAVIFRNGVLKASLGGMELYEGRGTAKFLLETDTPQRPYEIQVNLENVSALPLLEDVAEFGWLSGRVRAAIVLNGSLTSTDPFLSAVSGQGRVSLAEGALQGIDIAGVLNGLGKGELVKLKQPDGQTRFESLSGSFTLRGGVATTPDLALKSELLEVSASGTIDVVNRELDLVAEPRIVAEGNGEGASALKNLSVPVKVEGPWARPSVKPEFGAILQDPDKTKEAVQQLGDIIKKNVKSKKVQQAVDQLLNRNARPRSDQDTAPAPSQQRNAPEPEDEIDQLLR